MKSLNIVSPDQTGLTAEQMIVLQLEECENRQRELQSIRLALEKEISVKKTSISIDRDRCLR